MTDVDNDMHLDAILREAGAQWRSEQAYGPVEATPWTARRTGVERYMLSFGRLVAGLASMAALTAVVVIASPLVLNRPDGAPVGANGDNVAGLATPTPDVSPDDQAPSMDPTLMSSSAPSAAAPADPGAARLAAIEAVNVDRANFGGVYIDAEGVLVIQYVGDNAGRATVEQRLVPGVAVRWEKVERSRADLDAMVDTIRERNLGDVFAISIDTIANQVAVTVGPGGSVDEVRAALADYGDGVRVELDENTPVLQIGWPSNLP